MIVANVIVFFMKVEKCRVKESKNFGSEHVKETKTFNMLWLDESGKMENGEWKSDKWQMTNDKWHVRNEKRNSIIQRSYSLQQRDPEGCAFASAVRKGPGQASRIQIQVQVQVQMQRKCKSNEGLNSFCANDRPERLRTSRLTIQINSIRQACNLIHSIECFTQHCCRWALMSKKWKSDIWQNWLWMWGHRIGERGEMKSIQWKALNANIHLCALQLTKEIIWLARKGRSEEDIRSCHPPNQDRYHR